MATQRGGGRDQAPAPPSASWTSHRYLATPHALVGQRARSGIRARAGPRVADRRRFDPRPRQREPPHAVEARGPRSPGTLAGWVTRGCPQVGPGGRHAQGAAINRPTGRPVAGRYRRKGRAVGLEARQSSRCATVPRSGRSARQNPHLANSDLPCRTPGSGRSTFPKGCRSLAVPPRRAASRRATRRGRRSPPRRQSARCPSTGGVGPSRVARRRRQAAGPRPAASLRAAQEAPHRSRMAIGFVRLAAAPGHRFCGAMTATKGSGPRCGRGAP